MAGTLNLKELTRSYREGKFDLVRKALWKHRDSGKKLNPDGYSLLLSTYERGKPDARLAELLDERAALLDKKDAGKLLFQGNQALAALFVKEKRWSDALRLIEAVHAYAKDLSLSSHALLFDAARRLGPEAQARALLVHERVVKRDRDALHVPKIVKAAKAAAEAAKKAKTTKAVPTTADELQTLIDAIAQAGGKATSYDCDTFSSPEGLGAAELAKLKLPNGKKLPPTLARWLAFDASWLPLFREGKGHEWDVVTLRDFFVEYAAGMDLEPDVGETLAKHQPDGLKPATKVIVLPSSASQEHLYVVDKLGKDGEAAVYGNEKEELFKKYASFGDFVTDYFSAGAPKPKKKQKKATKKKATKKKATKKKA